MVFLFGAIFIMIAYFAVRRDEASAKWADKLFYFGACLIVCGVIGMFIGLYLKHRQ